MEDAYIEKRSVSIIYPDRILTKGVVRMGRFLVSVIVRSEICHREAKNAPEHSKAELICPKVISGG